MLHVVVAGLDGGSACRMSILREDRCREGVVRIGSLFLEDPKTP